MVFVLFAPFKAATVSPPTLTLVPIACGKIQHLIDAPLYVFLHLHVHVLSIFIPSFLVVLARLHSSQVHDDSWFHGLR
jgi:hypothetical protein